MTLGSTFPKYPNTLRLQPLVTQSRAVVVVVVVVVAAVVVVVAAVARARRSDRHCTPS